MAKMLESLEMESVVREYKEKIAQALEAERNKLKERAEQDSDQIIARAEEQSKAIIEGAQQEAQQILTATRNRADEEGTKRIAQAQQKAEQLIRDADRRAEDKAKEKTKHEVEQIIARAKEEVAKAVAQARQEAKIESDRITAKSREEAEQAVKESREEAEQVVKESREKARAEARQESVKIISETREQAMRIITEVIETGTTQVKNEFGRAASKARSKLENETSGLLTQLTKSIEQVIGETETNIQADLEHLAALIAEAERKLQPAPRVPNEEATVTSQQLAQEAVSPVASISEKTEAADDAVEDKKDAHAPKERNEARLYKGRLNLEVAPPFDRERLERVQECLARVPSLKVLSTGGYTERDRWIMTYTIDLKEPMPLLEILKAMPPVHDVAEHKEEVMMILK